MRFKVDENLPVEVVARLRRSGYDALSVRDQDMVGQPDAALLTACRHESRVLVTLDLDFADARSLSTKADAGVIVLRAARQSRAQVLAVFDLVLRLLAAEPLAGQLWIADESAVRIRRLADNA
ncbi:MAG TPA: DUF5615 family PIN-like protein [Phycisphaerae bacterium]|nr:DUF5615 family PIN-like protein [Phycisphaerae bacterium]HNU44727.1 DUF5615 family PIN-like protein [Phycisphaerae bacterium]